MTVNITCMMVLASVYLYVSGSLPTTSAIKPVEIWLIFNLAFPFLIILSNVILQVSFTNPVSSLTPFVQVLEKSERKAKVSSASKVFLPEKNEATVSRGVGYSFFKNFSYYYNPLLYITFSALYFTFYNITIV